VKPRTPNRLACKSIGREGMTHQASSRALWPAVKLGGMCSVWFRDIPIACRRNQDRLSARLSAGVEGSPGHHRRYVEGSKPIASTDCSVGRRPRSDPTNTQGKVARRIVGRNVEPPQYCLMMPRRTCTPVAAQQMLTEQHSKCSRNLRSCQQPAYLMPSARSECVRGRCHLRGPILNRCRPIQRPE